jgi:hypothetical protein
MKEVFLRGDLVNKALCELRMKKKKKNFILGGEIIWYIIIERKRSSSMDEHIAKISEVEWGGVEWKETWRHLPPWGEREMKKKNKICVKRSLD